VKNAFVASRTLLFSVALGLMSNSAMAQMLTPETIDQHEREIFKAWGAHDPVRLADLDATGGVGFGFRARDARVFTTKDQAVAGTKAFFESVAYYRITPEEIHTKVVGDVGLAWGLYTEEFQVKGRPAERIRARFSDTWKRDESGWHLLTYHRDAQPFDGSGRYIPVPVP
jgi:hypothetical protein